jgi:hypothetical protein
MQIIYEKGKRDRTRTLYININTYRMIVEKIGREEEEEEKRGKRNM